MRGIPAIAAGGLWVVLLYAERHTLWAHEEPTANVLIPLLGVCIIAALYDLYVYGKQRWRVADVVSLVLAGTPAAFMIVAFAFKVADARVSPWMRNADWGLVTLSPATMLTGLTLLRRDILPRWNWVPILIGFVALPLNEIIKATTGSRELGLLAAMTLGMAWVSLGYALRFNATAPS